MIEHCTAIILTGGESKRMGQDKAALIFEDQTLLARAEQRLIPLFEEVVISVRKLRDDTVLRQVLDNAENRAPMMGIVAALKVIKTDWVCVAGVDMPFISPDLLRFMAEQRKHYDAVLVEMNGVRQPLLAFYRKAICLPVMQDRISQGKRSLIHFTSHIHANILTQQHLPLFHHDGRSFIDFDTKKDVTAFHSSH